MQINLRSTQTNVAFRKLFALPPEEFLIDDFTCHLKRKMPLQVVMAQLLLLVLYLKWNLRVSKLISYVWSALLNVAIYSICCLTIFIVNQYYISALVDGPFDSCQYLFPFVDTKIFPFSCNLGPPLFLSKNSWILFQHIWTQNQVFLFVGGRR